MTFSYTAYEPSNLTYYSLPGSRCRLLSNFSEIKWQTGKLKKPKLYIKLYTERFGKVRIFFSSHADTSYCLGLHSEHRLNGRMESLIGLSCIFLGFS